MRQQAGRLLWCILAVLMIGATTPSVGLVQTTTRVSVGPMGEEMDKDSISQTITADGRYVVNGTADVIWRNSISGAVAVWLMNGLIISSVEFPGSLSTDWVVAGR